MKIKKIISIFLACIITLVMINVSVFAAGGDGTGGGSGSGDGTGGGSGQPLTIVASTPADGATDVAIDDVITLEFSKNVAYLTVRDDNLTAVSIYNGETLVPAEVTMADDQLEPDLRNFMTITPSEPLEEATTYTIKVEPIVTSKSGDVLESAVEINFTTAGGVEDVVTTMADNTTSSNSILIFAIIGLLVIVIAVVLVKRKKA
ncbi:Ig-like domain-containing protein [Eubacteriaceae bacterium ES3]|nr:Ig-like domain-containing protein [Eubacteriaceae bacterium ES3]